MDTITLQDAINLFVGTYKPSSAKSYRWSLSSFVRWMGAGRPLSEIDNVDLLRFVASEINQKDYAPATKVKRVKAVKRFFNWCVEMGFLSESPATVLKTPSVPRKLSREKAMPEWVFNRILAYAEGETPHSARRPRDLALLLMLSSTGIRRISAAHLTMNAIDMDRRLAFIIGKGGHEHVVRFSPYCADVLAEWFAMRTSEAGDYLWMKDGRFIKPEAIAQIIRRMCKAVDAGSYGSHSIRHKLGHAAADAGVPITITATMLGHASTKTTETYYPADFETAHQMMDKLAKSNPSSGDKLRNFPRKKAK